MKAKVEIPHGEYVDVEYRQFDPSRIVRGLMKILGWVSIPFVYPLVFLTKTSPETGFRTISELLSLIPFALGIIVRYEFYRRALRACGRNVFISFGTVFYYPEITIGNNVLIGMYNTVHHCDFGSNVMTAEGCRFLSGSKYHSFSRTDLPMTQQGGRMKRIRIGDDVWIGANAIVMDDVCDGSVVGAGAVVTKRIEPYTVVLGNPARIVSKRV
jgi:acetyltransferase-like isoleucine patch superfamily enzyme